IPLPAVASTGRSKTYGNTLRTQRALKTSRGFGEHRIDVIGRLQASADLVERSFTSGDALAFVEQTGAFHRKTKTLDDSLHQFNVFGHQCPAFNFKFQCANRLTAHLNGYGDN